MMVPHPVRLALLEMTSPSAKKCVPPIKCKLAAFVPSPITKGTPFEMIVLFVRKVPLLKTNRLPAFVPKTRSAVTVPPSRASVPLATST